MTATYATLPTADTGACGTDKGHRRHRRRREQPCRPCMDAANLARNGHRPRLREVPMRLDTRPAPAQMGQLAGLHVWHAFRPLSMSQCASCFGWRDDVRHPVIGGPVVGR